ncbi:glycosyltransferase [Chitinimonas lacunae]|uniref:Glycosyltransferase n=1 Tax=Chitinimonas lacunae TaxID=1963018 RepID=A0ABV8MY04_9NEIS
MKRIHVIHEYAVDNRPHSCSYIRLLQPLSHPAIADRYDISFGLTMTERPVDAVILERVWMPTGINWQQAEELVWQIRAAGARLIYTLDDNLVDLGIDSPQRGFPSDLDRNVVRWLIREADGVIVSTEALARRFAGLNHNILVVPNQLDERLFPSELASRPERDKLVIGYMGTFSHQADFAMVLEALRALLHDYPGRTRFEFIGVTTNPAIFELLRGYDFDALSCGDDYHYPNFIRWAGRQLDWDIGIAPLRDERFNRYKSDIKYLDYGLLGIPAVYSDMPIYRDSVRDGETGLLAAADVDAWYRALQRLVEEDALRQSIRRQAFTEVARQRTWKYRAADWHAALEQLLA